jgi:[ribosomal protein S5]-alanine N-acetyltransferase
MAADREKMILGGSDRVVLRHLTEDDREEFIRLVIESAGFLYPWVVLPETVAKFDEYIQRFDGENAVCLIACHRESGAIVGSFSVVTIMRGPYQRGTVGYNAFASTTGLGYMSEGLRLVLRFVFGNLGLHRLEADIQPGNEASLKLARKLGFRREGYSPGLICIRGEWKDHERWAINGTSLGRTSGSAPLRLGLSGLQLLILTQLPPH